MSDRKEVSLIQSQWKTLSDHDLSRNNALWRLCELLDRSITAQAKQSEDLTKWIGTLNDTSKAGFALMVEAIAKLQIPLPQPQPKQVEVRFMFVVKDDHEAVNFFINLGDVTDAEGNVVTDANLEVAVESSDSGVLSVDFNAFDRKGVVSFGSPGVASLTAKVTSGDKLLGSGAADFTVTVGDPAAISNVALSFDGLTEQ
jgi:hypothetical protein